MMPKKEFELFKVGQDDYVCVCVCPPKFSPLKH